MSDDGIFDSHTHVFPSPEAAAAFRAVLTGARPELPGDASDALAAMERLGVRAMVLLPLLHGRRELEARAAELGAGGHDADLDVLQAWLAERWSAYNAWAQAAAREHPGRFLATVATDPVLLGADWARGEIERGIAAGARGLKLMPGWIGVPPDDERLAVVWEAADRHGLPVVSMCGLLPASDVAHPDRYEAVADAYPRATIVLAHVGMGAEERVARLTRLYPNVFADTSSWFDERMPAGTWLNRMLGSPGVSPVEAADLFRDIGTDRILFGTNYAIRPPNATHAAFASLPLSRSERRQIGVENHLRVWGE